MRRAVLVAAVVLLASQAHAVVFGQFFVHGKGFSGLSDPSWAYDYWNAGSFMRNAQGCGGMAYTYSHVNGTRGLYAAFNLYDCGCGLTAYFGCTTIMRPSDGSPDPGYVPPAGCAGTTVPRYYKLKEEGVGEQIYDFLQQSGVTDLTVITHSMGGNVVRAYLSQTNFYDECFATPYHPAYQECLALRDHQLFVNRAITHVLALHTPFTGSEAADLASTLSGSWLTGWITDWINPADASTKDCTTKEMGRKNSTSLYGTLNRPFPILTARGDNLRVARWIALGSALTTSQQLEDGGHPEDYELAGAAAAIPFAGGYSDGLVSWASQMAVATGTTDRWRYLGQHDTVATAAGGGSYVGNNHHHARGAFGGRWRPQKWDPSCPAIQGCLQPPGYYSNNAYSCPDAICKVNQTRGYPLGGDEAFNISAFVQARAAAACGPAITIVPVFTGRYWPILHYDVNENVTGIDGYAPAYDNYAPNAGMQICNSGC